MLFLRRTILLIACLAGPPLLAWGLYEGSQYYLVVSHKFLDAKTQTYAFYFELALFYFAGLLELRSRWSPVE